MKVAHIILAHNKPWQLKLLLEKLRDNDATAFVHLDKKSNLEDFNYLKSYPDVRLVQKRQYVNWGGFSQVRAIIASVEEVINSGLPFDYLNLLSGQDFPIKPFTEFKEFLEVNRGKIFFEYYLPGHKWLKEAEMKLKRFHLTDFKFKGSYRLERIIDKILPTICFPIDFKIIGHSCWFTIDWETATFLIQYFKANKSFINKFRFTWGADEILIPSIIYNSHLQSKLINNNLRYIVWEEGKDSPKTLTIDDRFLLNASDCFFARKFDVNVDEEIIQYLSSKS